MDEVINFDQQLLLALNGSESTYLDNIFTMVTRTGTWIPLVLVLLYILLKNRPWREVVLFVLCLALVILVADRVSSGLAKPLFHRFRPSHEPALEGLVDLVDGRRGGLYGFFSSHAANTFGAWAFIALYLRRRPVTWTLLLWACLSSYSRIYLGLHYPGDILCGALFGSLTGLCVYALMLWASARWLEPLRPDWPVAPTVLGYRSNPEGIEPRDALLFALAFLVTLAVIALLALW
ncbi:MAG: phosphatase PAP2 family protein [Bacteroidaceae bacterium]|nr:phosphatase PAP2 family protein [Bacteroidaceae bacterium]